MADPLYQARVDRICERLNIKNPIEESQLTVKRVTFHFENEPPLPVEPTDMNRAGRAYLQYLAGRHGRRRVSLDRMTRQISSAHFPAPSWSACSREAMQIVYGCKHAIQVEIEK